MNSNEKADILIVDDRPENLIALEALLENPELNIVKAFSGNEALGLVLEYDFALVLLDVQMPEMEGYETAKLMRGIKRSKNVPIIFLTAISGEQKHLLRGYESGAVDFLFKPIEPNILMSKVRIFLELFNQKRLINEQALELKQNIEELLLVKKELEKSNSILQALSSIDGLTGLPNRRSFDDFVEKEWKSAVRKSTPLSFVMIDIDHFKAYNDNYGHQAGDECLKQIGRVLKEAATRPEDLIARYGGEEFIATLVDTDINGAITVAERIRSKLKALNIPHGFSTTANIVTISLGIAGGIPNRESLPGSFITMADKALYQAKKEGRNQIKIFTETEQK
ncbi:MAG: diguanylate cyclase [Desulfobacterium sp.]|nr:diguanylate cyclase [Desulfobacterium sp.]